MKLKTAVVSVILIGLTLFWVLIAFPVIMVLWIALGGPSPEPVHDPYAEIASMILAATGYLISLFLLRRWSR